MNPIDSSTLRGGALTRARSASLSPFSSLQTVLNLRMAVAALVVCFAFSGTTSSAATSQANSLFSASGQSLWNPGGAFQLVQNRSIGPGGWSLGDGIDATRRVCFIACATFGARIGAETSGNFGINYGVGIDGGSLNLRYPSLALCRRA